MSGGGGGGGLYVEISGESTVSYSSMSFTNVTAAHNTAGKSDCVWGGALPVQRGGQWKAVTFSSSEKINAQCERTSVLGQLCMGAVSCVRAQCFAFVCGAARPTHSGHRLLRDCTTVPPLTRGILVWNHMVSLDLGGGLYVSVDDGSEASHSNTSITILNAVVAGNVASECSAIPYALPS